MTHSARSRAAVGAALLALSPLFAPRGALLQAQQQQQQQQSAPADTAPASAATVASSPNVSTLMTQEIYVAAFRASARRWCESAGPRAGDEPLRSAVASTHLITHGGVVDAERAGVDQAVDSAYADLVHGGGCVALARPATVVVADRFDGHAWNTPKREIAPNDRGASRESGVTVVTRGVKLGHRRFHKIGAEADYTFTTQGGMLVSGRDRVPTDADNATTRWAAVEQDILQRYPTLLVTRRQSGAPGSSDVTLWRTLFTNPDTQALEITLSAARGADGKVWITAEYPGLAGR